MLPAENRLKKEKDFENAFESGKGYKEGLLRIKVAGNGLESSRFGFIVSKKYSKRASERNSIKRRLREITRESLPDVKPGLDIILIVMPGLENGFEILSALVGRLFKKARILKK